MEARQILVVEKDVSLGGERGWGEGGSRGEGVGDRYRAVSEVEVDCVVARQSVSTGSIVSMTRAMSRSLLVDRTMGWYRPASDQ